jgi:hypothetical protein
MPGEKVDTLYIMYRDDWPGVPMLWIYERSGARYWLVQLSGLAHEERFPQSWSVQDIARHFIDHWFDQRITHLLDGTTEREKPWKDVLLGDDPESLKQLKQIKSELETSVIAGQQELFV